MMVEARVFMFWSSFSFDFFYLFAYFSFYERVWTIYSPWLFTEENYFWYFSFSAVIWDFRSSAFYLKDLILAICRAPTALYSSSDSMLIEAVIFAYLVLKDTSLVSLFSRSSSFCIVCSSSLSFIFYPRASFCSIITFDLAYLWAPFITFLVSASLLIWAAAVSYF